jgi:hypothetical protein
MRRILLPLFVLTTVLACACSVRKGELRPLNPTPTGGPSFSRQPQLVSFSELQAGPDRYQDRFIRVSGAFSPVEVPTCRPRSGPFVTWSLVADNLRLDVVGYEELAGRVAVDEAFTVDGYFRLYEGPWGCGKEPQVDTIWYLEVARVVQPNPIRLVSRGLEGPLPMVILAPRIGSAFTPLPDAGEIEGELPDTGPPDALGSPMPTQEFSGPSQPTPPGEGTVATLVPTATMTGQAPATLTATLTPSPGPSPLASPTGAGTPTVPAGPTLTPLPTATPDSGYPGPPTETPEGEPTSYP